MIPSPVVEPSISTKLLNFVPDSLDLRILRHSAIHPGVLDCLQEWRSYQDAFEYGKTQPFFIEVAGVGTFRLHDHGTRPYEFTLINPEIGDIRIWNPDKNKTAISTQTGQLYINFRSSFLQKTGLEGAKHVIQQILQWFYQKPDAHGFCRVARADLAADVQYRRLEWTDVDQFVTRARLKDTFMVDSVQAELAEIEEMLKTPPEDNKGGAKYMEGVSEKVKRLRQRLFDDSSPSRIISRQRPQTIYLGRFGSPLYARVYDKTASLDKQNKGYMRGEWLEAGWDGETPVIRTEFSMSGDFLKETSLDGEIYDLRDLDTFERHIPDLWAYLTGSWLKHCDTGQPDQNRSRWEVSDFWRSVSEAATGSRVLSRKPAPRCPLVEALAPCLYGLLTSMSARAAVLKKDIYHEAVELLFKISQWMESDEYLDKVEEKRILYGTDDYSISQALRSDTEISTAIRSEVMRRGNGS